MAATGTPARTFGTYEAVRVTDPSQGGNVDVSVHLVPAARDEVCDICFEVPEARVVARFNDDQMTTMCLGCLEGGLTDGMLIVANR